jgi:hypothetical protein
MAVFAIDPFLRISRVADVIRKRIGKNLTAKLWMVFTELSIPLTVAAEPILKIGPLCAV